jgi:hypothetical protein
MKIVVIVHVSSIDLWCLMPLSTIVPLYRGGSIINNKMINKKYHIVGTFPKYTESLQTGQGSLCCYLPFF